MVGRRQEAIRGRSCKHHTDICGHQQHAHACLACLPALPLAPLQELAEHFGISFNSLLCLNNMPIKRWADHLARE